MGVQASYTLTVSAPSDTHIHDLPYHIYLLRRAFSEAKHFLDENGNSTGNAGDWRSIEQDMRSFSRANPDILYKIREVAEYDGTSEAEFYFKNGKMVRIEPELVWPVWVEADMK